MIELAAPVRGFAARLFRRRRADDAAFIEEPALRTALLTGEQMRAFGRVLASRHIIADRPPGERLLGRLAANQGVLVGVGRLLAESLVAGRRITPAGEWLLDNLYLIEQEIGIAGRHLPRGYSKELPRLADDPTLYGPGAGQPRIFDLALNAVSHGDGQLALDTLAPFVAAYQEKKALSLGELWALPIMLRLALIENLRRAAVAVADGQRARDTAETWAARMLKVADERPSDLIIVVADLARSDVELNTAFVADLARRLQGRGAAMAMPLGWIEQRLHDGGRSIESMFRDDSRLQAEWQLTVANSIGSLRLVGATEWRDFVEVASTVERTLRDDPLKVYARMDFASRDAYRHAVERLARRARRNESDIARSALALAQAAHKEMPARAAAGKAHDPREAHVGHYLVGRGGAALESELGLHPRANARTTLARYLGAIALATLLLAALPAHQLALAAELPTGWWLALLPPLAIVASQLSIALANWLSTLIVAPRMLPRLDFSDGIDPDASTLVVVPTLLTSRNAIDALVDGLEVHHLANRDPRLRFALLTDLRDAANEHEASDDSLVQHAAARIAALNRRHPRAGGDGDNFALMHRPRLWNERERRWMGFERKRGKLHALNALLRGRAKVGSGEAFSRIVGDVQALGDIRFVITLDSDTELPHGSAAQLVAAMVHPLQRAHAGADGIVDDGHAILQPRSTASLPSALMSRHARLFGADAGIDPYTHAVSDVYQDLFDEGSFIGKGIYDVDAFERALDGRLPEGRVLSHDLIEGGHARSGLISDVTLFEQAPLRHASEAARRHRWTRGDWQLLPWLRRRVRALPGAPLNPLSALSRWKLFDNLRRSLVAPSAVLLLLAAWFANPSPGAWTIGIVAVLGLVPLLAQASDAVRRQVRRAMGSGAPGGQGAPSRAASITPVLRLLHQLALLADEAQQMLDAIGRTLWRLFISRRRLLEWTASADLPPGAPAGSAAALREALRAVPAGPLVALVTAVLLALLRPWALPAAAPLLVLWAFAPLVVWWLDQPPRSRAAALSPLDRADLRNIARRTWHFFEEHVGADDNHLPPDNLQIQPTPRIAHRTSPTNVGFALLASLSARDLGWLTLTGLEERVGATFGTLDRLERWRGHFLNWYDTQTLLPLAPRYVSSVDSGNLVAALLVLRAGLLAMADEPLFEKRWFDGVRDTLDQIKTADIDGAANAETARFVERLDAARETPRAGLAALGAAFESLRNAAVEIQTALAASHAGTATEALPLASWADALVRQCEAVAAEYSALVGDATGELATASAEITLRELTRHANALPAAVQAFDRLHALAERALAFTEAVEHDFLYDPRRRLLTIGWNVDERRRDAGNYDLLASEARLGVYVAIAQGRLPSQAWFALGRGLAAVEGEPALLSWSGSMFEYLMPALLMPQVDGTLLSRSCSAAVLRQIDYGAECGLPWGMSESGYNTTDSALNYQYRAFGVPGLGLKRGLSDDLVVAPYATLMALIVEPARACANLRELARLGAFSQYGFFEAIDFTPGRLPPGRKFGLVQSYMAHHQGMGLLALAQALVGPRMQARFASDPNLRAALPLLHEKAPSGRAAMAGRAYRTALRVPEARRSGSDERRFATADTPQPEVQLLSNGRYHVMLSAAGSGSSRWQDLSLTRWREDATCDDWGSWCYLRDLDSGKLWSTTMQPTLAQPTRYQAVFSEGRAEFRRLDHGIDAQTTIAVSPEDDIELRRVRLRNVSRSRRRIELTSYAEVVLASAAADAQHPAFSKLFVQTELLLDRGAILCRRRPRAEGEKWPWMFQLMAVQGLDPRASWLTEISHETDRARFIGRGRNLQSPMALEAPGPLSNTAGAVLDPVVASRCVISIEPDRSRLVDFVTGVAATREQCLALIDKYRDRRLADRVFELAWTHAQVLLRQLDVSAEDAQLFGQLAGMLVYAQATLRADEGVIRSNRRSQSGLWGYSISGDLPIVLVTIADNRHIDLVRQLVLAHAWWRQRGLAVDLVIWNEEHETYRQRLHEQIHGLVAAGREANAIERPGGIFLRHADQIAPEDRVLLMSVARAIFSAEQGTLAEQLLRSAQRERRRTGAGLRRASDYERRRTPLQPSVPARVDASAPLLLPTTPLRSSNGYGGFAEGAREYVIAPAEGAPTPAPWVNVLANERLGCVISESGSAYTWFGNAHEYRLTPWHNDPVSDGSGEAFYLRDEESGEYWSPCTWPTAPRPAMTRHGFGSSTFVQQVAGIRSELRTFIDVSAPVRFVVIDVFNPGAATRRLSATGYVEWVLGSQRATSAPHVVSELAPGSGALLARNAFGQEHHNHVGFFNVDTAHRPVASVTAHRSDFIGRNGSLRAPQAMRETRLSGRVGAALDPCAAIQVPLVLAPGAHERVVFMLGAGLDANEATELLARHGDAAHVDAALQRVHTQWQGLHGTLQVATPDAALDALANGWLLYQVLSCRLWGRSGFYQSGGAYGFRDQLQDTMALVHAAPALLRGQLLRCAARQFPEGDVQHWWHPQGGRGVRTHCSDDYLWLPWALVRYWRTSGDRGVCGEVLPFIEGRAVAPGDEAYFDVPQASTQSATLYEHARRAVEHGLRYGVHGLPLMGSGDWNDGMNRVGHEGRGESVWLAFFLHRVLRDFAPLAQLQGDSGFAERCELEAATLASRIEASAWDGEWYLRAWFDDGTPLGGAASPECRIDLVAQSWSVLSGVAAPERAASALAAMQAQLIDSEAGIARLLTPPFDGHGPDPGYIAGYVPGVRENGGQYTHAAIWAAMALAQAGHNEEAWRVVKMINPILHARNAEEAQRYRVEPYVLAADVYGVAPHTGRGGWTWYTGAAGWLYRLITESLLGITLEHDGTHAHLRLAPRLPAAWPGFSFTYRRGATSWLVEVRRGEKAQLELDGALLPELRLRLDEDGVEHRAVLSIAD